MAIVALFALPFGLSESTMDLILLLLAAIFLYLLYAKGYLPGFSPHPEPAYSAEDADTRRKRLKAKLRDQIDRAQARKHDLDEMKVEAKRQYLHGDSDLDTYKQSSAEIAKQEIDIKLTLKDLEKQLEDTG